MSTEQFTHAFLHVVENPLEPDNASNYLLKLDAEHRTIGSMVTGEMADNIVIGKNGHVVDQADFGITVINPGDHITVVPILRGGGDSGKNTLRLVAFAALAYVSGGIASGAIGGLTGFGAAAAGLAVNVVGGLVINQLLPIQPAQPTEPEAFDDAASYGLDGPKQTAQQGLPLPIVYGRARVAGNRVGLYSEDRGNSNQTAFALIALCEGPISGVSPEATLINDQPVGNFDVNLSEEANARSFQAAYSVGHNDGERPAYFESASVAQNVNAKVTDEWTYYTTVDEIVDFKINFYAPALYRINEKGKRVPVQVQYTIQYRKLGDVEWRTAEDFETYEEGSERAAVKFDDDKYIYTGRRQIDIDNGREFVFLAPAVAGGVIGQNPNPESIYNEDGTVKAFFTSESLVYPTIQITTGMPVYERLTGYRGFTNGGGTIPVGEEAVRYEKVGTIVTYRGYSAAPRIVGESARAVRRTYDFADSDTAVLPNGTLAQLNTKTSLQKARYEIRWRLLDGFQPGSVFYGTAPNSPPNLAESTVGETFVSDVIEVRGALPGFVNTAYADCKILLGERLNSVPSTSFDVTGKMIRKLAFKPDGTAGFIEVDSTNLVDSYDEFGNPVKSTKRTLFPSSNPADILLDILTYPRFKVGYTLDQIDLDAFATWAAYCDLEGLEFNAVLETRSNAWDAIAYVLRAGHASLIEKGNKLSLAIEMPETPSMLFTVGSIIKSSLNVEWYDKSDRINEVEVSYYDSFDRFKRKTVVVSDTEGVALAEGKQRIHKLDGYWITNAVQAEKEAVFELNMSKLIDHSVTFRTSGEAARLRVGSVFLLQHSLPNWGDGGRLEAGSTTSVVELDREVTMVSGRNYAILVTHSTLERFSGTNATIHDAGAVDVVVTELSTASYNEDAVTRLIVEGTEYAVKRVNPDSAQFGYSGKVSFVLDKKTGLSGAGHTWSAWDTHVIEQRDVVTQEGDTTTLTLTEPLTQAPERYSVYAFGETDLVRRPYRVQRISGYESDEIEIFAAEYNAAVYDLTTVGAFEAIVQDDPISHVRELEVEERLVLTDSVYQPEVILTWQSPALGSYEGASVMVRKSADAPFELVEKVAQQRTSLTYRASPNEELEFRVIAFDPFGRVPPVENTPGVEIAVTGDTTPPAHVTNLTIKSDINQLALRWTNPADADFKTAIVWRSNGSDSATATRVAEVDGETFSDQVDPGTTWHYWVTAKDYAGNESDVTGAPTVSGEARAVELTDIPGLPPEYQVLVVRDNMELFPLTDNVSGNRGTVGQSFNATRVPGASLFGSAAYSFDVASENLLYSGNGVDISQWPSTNGTSNLATAFGTRDGAPVTRIDATGQTNVQIRGNVSVSELTDGHYYTCSVYIKNVGAEAGVVAHIDWCDRGGKSITLAPGETARVSTRANSVEYTGLYRFFDINVNAGHVVEAWMPQVERPTYPTAFMRSSGRPAASYAHYPQLTNNVNRRQFGALWWYKCNELIDPGEHRIFFPSRDGMSVRIQDIQQTLTLRGALQGGENFQVEWPGGYIPVTDHDWHLMGFMFNGEEGYAQVFMDDQFFQGSVTTGATLANTSGNENMQQGGWMETSDDRYSIRGFITQQLVVKSGVLAPETVKKIHQLRAPFIDPGVVVQAPNPENVTIQLL